MSRSRIALVVLFFASFVVAPSPAQAASTVLCTGYTSCVDKGYAHGGYATAKSSSYWNMYTGTNCTNYVAYRLVTTNGMPNKRPASGVGNARDWGTAMASVTDSTPTVGAVAWWGKTGNHVAYIEKVVSPTEIWVSESNWSGAFDWRKITKSGGGWPDGIIHFKDSPAAPSAPSALTSTAAPVVSGTLRYGQTLTATGGAWSPTPSSLKYQWIVNGVDIAGETSTTFKPRPQDVGKPVSMRVRAARNGHTAAFATSAPTAALAPAPVSVSARPAVTGTARVGKTLTASTGTWSRTGLSFSYQWLADGAALPGATSASYTLRSADAGRTLSIQVTAARPGYRTTTTSSADGVRVAPGTISVRSRPSVSGTPRVGSRLTASPGTWSPAADLSYQWYAGSRAVSGATQRTFTPTHRERGAAVRVKVVARKAGFTAASSTSPLTRAVATGQIKISAAPSVAGTPVLGTTLTAQAGTTAPATAGARYQWLRDGTVISGATGRSRKVAVSDLGRRLSVRVSYKAPGYSTRVTTSAALAAAKSPAKLSVSVAKPSAGTATFTIAVKVSSKVAAPAGSITVRSASGVARTAKVVRGRATVTLKGLPAGSQRFRLDYRGTSAVAPATVEKTATIR